MPFHLHLRLGQIGHEFRHAFVLGRLLAAHHPQRSAADDRILWRALDVVVVGHEIHRPLELRGLLDPRLGAGTAREHRALAARELGIALVGAPGVGEPAVLGEVGQHADMTHMERRVDGELRVHPAHAVLLGADRHVMPGAEVLDVHPRRPAGRVNARLPGRFQLAGRDPELLPGLRRLLRIKPGLLERILVDIKQHRRTVERERQHVALAVGVVARHGWEIGLRLERLLRISHDFRDRYDGAFGTHHRRCADLEHLQDVRRATGAECCNRRGHRLRIGAFEHRVDLVFLLAGVELAGDFVELLAKGATH